MPNVRAVLAQRRRQDPAASANSVDCQRWFVSAPIISPSLSLARRIFGGSPPVLVARLDHLLELADVVAGEFAGFGELRHHRLGLPAEETQDLVEQPVRVTSRATIGSKMCALLIFRTRRTAFLPSSR